MTSEGTFNKAVCLWIESQKKTLKVHDLTDADIHELYSRVKFEEDHKHPGIE
jgi:hypothetical protein